MPHPLPPDPQQSTHADSHRVTAGDAPPDLPLGRPSRPVPARGWKVADLVAGGVLDLEAGQAPVPVSVWRATHPDHSQASEGIEGLTPRLAAMLVATYTRPGQRILDTTGDVAVQGAAGAGARPYQHITLPPRRPGRHVPGSAGLILVRWPPASEPSDPRRTRPPGSSTASAAPPASPLGGVGLVPDPSALLAACRRLLTRGGHTVVILTPAPADAYAQHARVLIPAARDAGLGYLQHLLVVTTPINAREAEHPLAGTGQEPWFEARGPLNMLVFVLGIRS